MKDKGILGNPRGASRKDVIFSANDMFGRNFTTRAGEPHLFPVSCPWASKHGINIACNQALRVATETRAYKQARINISFQSLRAAELSLNRPCRAMTRTISDQISLRLIRFPIPKTHDL